MIDWITAIVPCFHVTPLSGGRITKTTASGEIEWSLYLPFLLLVVMIHLLD